MFSKLIAKIIAYAEKVHRAQRPELFPPVSALHEELIPTAKAAPPDTCTVLMVERNAGKRQDVVKVRESKIAS